MNQYPMSYRYKDIQLTPGYCRAMYDTLKADGYAIPFTLEEATPAQLRELKRQYNIYINEALLP